MALFSMSVCPDVQRTVFFRSNNRAAERMSTAFPPVSAKNSQCVRRILPLRRRQIACAAATDGRDSVVRPGILAEQTLRSESPSFSSGGTADYFAVALMCT